MTLVERLQATGIRRLGSPSRGFRYRGAKGGAIAKRDRERISALRIPPAWRDVAISASPASAVQAVGRDAAGRWQYLYHARHVAQRGRKKFQRVVHFLAALPRMRRAIARDLALPGLPREKVLACILRILSTCFLRPGSQVYADENRSYGIATLTRRHVTVRGDTVSFDFPGKSGQRQERALSDRRVARIVRDLLRIPGKGGEVFKYLDADGRAVDVRRRHINEYIKEVMGERFSAKDFRTWAGTLICASALARAGAVPGESKAARKRTIIAAIRETATHLGNTPAVCRASYIEPLVLARFERGRVLRAYATSVEELLRYRGVGHHKAERALLAMLEQRGD
jgi:DNA topoisomerase I